MKFCQWLNRSQPWCWGFSFLFCHCVKVRRDQRCSSCVHSPSPGKVVWTIGSKMTSKILHFFDNHCTLYFFAQYIDAHGRLMWHYRWIPETEIWVQVHVGGDKGGSYFKMNFEIVNIPTPNSVQNTYVGLIFEANDTSTNLHVTLDCYKPQIEALEGMKWR